MNSMIDGWDDDDDYCPQDRYGRAKDGWAPEYCPEDENDF